LQDAVASFIDWQLHVKLSSVFAVSLHHKGIGQHGMQHSLLLPLSLCSCSFLPPLLLQWLLLLPLLLQWLLLHLLLLMPLLMQ
jgi:hypothetical protein